MPIDLGSVTQQVQEEMARPAASDVPRIWRAIIDSIRYYGHRRTNFNEEHSSWTTTVDQADYGTETVEGAGKGYPDDMLEPDEIYVEKSDALFWPLPQKSIAVVRRTQDSITAQGLPLLYAWHAQRIHLDRRAHEEYILHVDYMKDLGTPTYSYDGGEWIFLDPDGVTPLLSTFSNEWFTEADDLIRYRAQTRLSRWLKDDGEYMRAAELEAQAFQRVKGKSVGFQRPMQRTPAM